MTNTTNPKLRSFIDVSPESHFPIQNLPYGAFRRKSGEVHLGVAIGDYVLDLTILEANKMLPAQGCFFSDSLNHFMAAGRPVWTAVREKVSRLLQHDCVDLRDNEGLRDAALLPMSEVEMQMPAYIRDYTDFYSSRYHATNVGTMFRDPKNALLPNWLWVPVGYHGRASSVILSGTPIHRPKGQTRPDDNADPIFGPCRLLDFELEMGFFIGPGNELGKPISIESAQDHIFGKVLVNDWSARDIQKWEYQPLGPFLAKNFATTISPWIVTLDALAPFECDGQTQTDPAPLAYLDDRPNKTYDIHLEVYLQSEQMDAPTRICQSNFKYMYWNIRQQLTHHTVSGCNVAPGDMMASGTISGPTPGSYGSLLELAWRGTKPVKISESEERKFLLDNDTLTLTGWCQGDGYRVGFGEASGKILPVIS